MKAKYKNHQIETNEKRIKNHLNRAFNREQPMETLVSDLTYVKVGNMALHMFIYRSI